MKSSINTINEVWKELIKLQYRNGSILELKALQKEEISEAELFDIIEDFKQHNLLQYVPLGTTDCTFYVLVPDDIETAFPYLGITINYDPLNYEHKKIFLDTSTRILSELAQSSAEDRKYKILKENSNINHRLRNFRKEIDTSTREISKSERNSEGIEEIHIYYTKEDGNKTHFIIPFTTIWLQEHQEETSRDIEEVITFTIDSFLQDNEYHLDHSVYVLKTIGSLNQREEGKIVIKDLNTLAGLTFEELLFEKRL